MNSFRDKAKKVVKDLEQLKATANEKESLDFAIKAVKAFEIFFEHQICEPSCAHCPAYGYCDLCELDRCGDIILAYAEEEFEDDEL